MFLTGLVGGDVNLKGLLLAGMIIGVLGVLDDIIISQVSVVKELTETDNTITRKKIFARAMRVGTDHISALINTLFLAYAGAALPLLILFSIQAEPFLTWEQIVNNEMIATEIVRTLTGSMALVLAVPIATALAVASFTKQKGAVE